jgi:hypothetical protein
LSDDKAIRELSESVFKSSSIPLFKRGMKRWVLPFGKGELEGILSKF